MLKRVIENDHVGPWAQVEDLWDRHKPLFSYRYGELRKFLMELHRFIANFYRRCPIIRNSKSFCFSFVSTAEGRNNKFVSQHFNQQFHHWCFPGTSQCKISYANQRKIKTH